MPTILAAMVLREKVGMWRWAAVIAGFVGVLVIIQPGSGHVSAYGAMAAHYSVGVLPARPYRPRDKAKVEAGVRFAQTYILGRLRAQSFFSLAELNVDTSVG